MSSTSMSWQGQVVGQNPDYSTSLYRWEGGNDWTRIT
jgi:hypothetical protein